MEKTKTLVRRDGRLNLRLRDDERSKLVEIAREQGISISEAARQALRRVIRRETTNKAAQPAGDRK